ncbi:MAG: fatty acid desaturase [Kiloniellales bacterium]|nr:fatty acid desaturase [Kiloniellales bacterium]
MSGIQSTTPESSGVSLDHKALKRLARRSDRPGLIYLGLWALFLAGSGALLFFSYGTWGVVPAMILYGSILTVPAYALSHECAHGTAFRTRWLNELVFWVTSFVYFEGPHFRRYAHARHHTYTWNRAKDAQMPFNTPLTLKGWLLEISDLGQYVYDGGHMLRNAFGRFAPEVVDFAPASELPKLKWESRIFLALYLALAAAAAVGAVWILTFLVIPRLVGGVTMQLYTIIQHAELAEDQPDLTKSTRSFTTNRFGDFLYANMSSHLEHHLYPVVPFHALPRLNEALRDQLPAPSRGLLRTNAEVLAAIWRRSLGRAAVADQNPA